MQAEAHQGGDAGPLRPRFSILLPTHRSAETLRSAIASALAQTVADFEILLVLDGADAATRDVAREVTDPRLRVFDLPKAPGYGYANRNIALRKARGALIAFLADDDLYTPDHLERMGQAFEDPAISIAFSAPVWVSPTGAILPEPVDLGDPAHLHAFTSLKNFFPAACAVHRSAALERHGSWPESGQPAGDWDMWLRILTGDGPGCVAQVDEVTALHFRALRKTGATWGPPSVMGLERLAEDAAWWPARLALQIAPTPTPTPQAQVLSRMLAGPDALADIRTGRTELFHRLASRAFGGDFLGDGRHAAASPLWRPEDTATFALIRSGPDGAALVPRLRAALADAASSLTLTAQVATPLYNALDAMGARQAADLLALAAYQSEADKPWAIVLAARASAARGEVDEALAILSDAAVQPEPTVGMRRLRAQLLLAAGRPAEALPELRDLAAQFPLDGQLAEEEAEALLALGEEHAALAALRRAAELSPGNRQRMSRANALAARLNTG